MNSTSQRPASGRAIRARISHELGKNPRLIFETLERYFLETLFDEQHPASYEELFWFYDQAWREWCADFQKRRLANPLGKHHFLNSYAPIEKL